MNHKKVGRQNEVKPFQMQVLYNQLLEVATKMSTGIDVHKKDSPVFNKPAEVFKKSSWDETPNSDLVTFQDLLNGMANIQFSDDKEDYAEKIRKANHLSEKQKNLLLTNLWVNK